MANGIAVIVPIIEDIADVEYKVLVPIIEQEKAELEQEKREKAEPGAEVKVEYWELCERTVDAHTNSLNTFFQNEKRTHFARFVILNDPDSGPKRKRLLFEAIYDGRLDDYLADMKRNSLMEDIWKYCVGYPGLDKLDQFLLQHNNTTPLFLQAYPDETVENILKYLAWRDDLITRFQNQPISQYDNIIKNLPRPFFVFVIAKSILRSLWRLLMDIFITILNFVELINLVGRFYSVFWKALSRVFIAFSSLTLDRIYSEAPVDKSGPCYPSAPGDEVVSQKSNDTLPEFLERKMVQNQMSVVSINDPKTLRRQEAVLAIMGLGARSPVVSAVTKLFSTNTNTIETIHFGRWIMIDGGKRMLFLSNYDGSWESYIGDFVDKASGGLEATWGASIGWRTAASLDIEFFKEGIRCHQTPATYYFCAYPRATVVNIRRACDIYDLYHNSINPKKWLKLL